MKNIYLIGFIVLLLAIMVYSTYKYDRVIQAKDKRIKELEFQVWSLKLDKHLDSVVHYHVDAFKKRMDSIAGR